MLEITATQLRKNLRQEIQRYGENFVILSVADWRAVEETIYLNQIPGMVASIHSAAAESLAEGTRLEDLDW